MASLPRSFDLTEPLNALPDNATQTLITIRPDNAGPYSPQQIITLSLGQRGFLDPKSLSIRYKCVVVSNATASQVAMIGCPVFTPFQRLNEYCGGSTISSVNAYNQTCQALVSGSYSVSSKYGLQSCFGYTNAQNTNPNMDGRVCKVVGDGANVITDTFFMSAPLMA